MNIQYDSVLFITGVGTSWMLICSTLPSSYNPEKLAPTLWAEPFCNYISEGSVSHINCGIVCSSNCHCWRELILCGNAPYLSFFFLIKLLQSAAFKMSKVVIPALAAANAAAVREELLFHSVV